MKKIQLIPLILILTLALISCATTGKIDTDEKRYLLARSELNLFLSQYLEIQDKVSESDHSKAVIAFKSAAKALDIWEIKLTNDQPYTLEFEKWLELKSTLISILKEYYNE